MPDKIIKRILSPFSEFGFIAGLVYLADQAMMRMGTGFRFHFYEIMVQPVSTKPLAPRNLTRSFEVREIQQGDELLASMPPPRDIIDRRFRQDVVCLGAFLKGQFIGYQWLCFGPYDEDEVRCTFLPVPDHEAVFDFDFYLFAEHRLGLGFVALWDGANEYMRERGIRYTCSRVSRFNTASRKSHSHFGWKCIGKALFLRGKRVQIMFSNRAPYCHFSTGERSKPLIRIQTDTGA